ncbi:MAG: hypothetical protein GEU98_04110 [Pseudonocardiaceae bacterium]|nr:hypothetical protein [Pseudonocardiaceae bacterium]
MGTGIDSFTDPQNVGALYPFPGIEVVLAVVGILLWLGWHVHQTRIENQEYARAIELYRRVGTARALGKDGTEWLPSEEEFAAEAEAKDRTGSG